MVFVTTVGLFAIVVAGQEDRRVEDLTPRPDPLAATPLLPYLLPAALLAAGLALYGLITRGVTRRPAHDARAWTRVQFGFAAMMAVFEANALVGLAYYLRGASIATFFVFAGLTVLLFVVGLVRLFMTWPRDKAAA
jgi:hypothetical protein